MHELQGQLAPAEALRPATSGRWVVLWVLVALSFVSGIGASQDEFVQNKLLPGRLVVHTPVTGESVIDQLPADKLVAQKAVAPEPASEVRGVDEHAVNASAQEVVASVEPIALQPLEIQGLPLHGVSLGLGASLDASPDAIGSVMLPNVSAGPDFRRADPELIVVTKGELQMGQSLAGELAKRGISPATVHLLVTETQDHFNFRHSHPGHRYRLALDAEGSVVDFRYSTSPEESIYLFWDGETYVVQSEQAELLSRVVSLAGLVDDSLYEAIRELGEDPQLADDFSEIFAWDIDFTRNVKAGDAFRILYERLYLTDDDGDDIYVRPGRILAARYQGAVGEHSAVYFELEEGRGGYYRPNGTSVERAFLLAPLRYSRISSTFTNARRHPILKVTRRHPGIDYAAAEGTQLWAVADGTVIFRGYAGASGNLVKVRHSNGYVSQYAHLSRIADGLKVGQRVHQKEVIGYVGHTGLATGSHVCFRITKNGRYVNPMAIHSPAGTPIDLADSREFAVARDQLLAALDIRFVAASDEAL